MAILESAPASSRSGESLPLLKINVLPRIIRANRRNLGMRVMGLRTLLVAMAMLIAWPIQAQEFGRVGDVEAVGTSYHVFTRPGEATVQVLVLGAGGGIYEVAADTEIDEFLALMGGVPSFGVRSDKNRIEVTIRLYRGQEGARTLIYEAPIEEMLTNPGQYPELRDEDVFVVETVEKSRIGWRDVLSIFTSVSSLILLVDRVANFF